jgi:hypothetical protein
VSGCGDLVLRSEEPTSVKCDGRLMPFELKWMMRKHRNLAVLSFLILSFIRRRVWMLVWSHWSEHCSVHQWSSGVRSCKIVTRKISFCPSDRLTVAHLLSHWNSSISFLIFS